MELNKRQYIKFVRSPRLRTFVSHFSLRNNFKNQQLRLHRRLHKNATMTKHQSSSESDNYTSVLLKIMLYHLGLLLILIGYCVAGAFVLVTIEHANESKVLGNRLERSEQVNNTMVYLADMFWYWHDKNKSYSEWKVDVYQEIRKLSRFVVRSVSEFDYDGSTQIEENRRDWTFPNALLFTISLITTIGYGHITPRTSGGKIFTIFYSALGIPLLLIFVALMGSSLARLLRYSYSRLCCRWCRSRRRRSEFTAEVARKNGFQLPRLWNDDVGNEDYMPTREVEVPFILLLIILCLYIFLGTIIFHVWEGWDLVSSAYFTFISLSTIGLGDFIPNSILSKNLSHTRMLLDIFACAMYLLFGMALLGMCISIMKQQVRKKLHWIASLMCFFTETTTLSSGNSESKETLLNRK